MEDERIKAKHTGQTALAPPWPGDYIRGTTSAPYRYSRHAAPRRAVGSLSIAKPMAEAIAVKFVVTKAAILNSVPSRRFFTIWAAHRWPTASWFHRRRLRDLVSLGEVLKEIELLLSLLGIVKLFIDLAQKIVGFCVAGVKFRGVLQV